MAMAESTAKAGIAVPDGQKLPKKGNRCPVCFRKSNQDENQVD